VSLDSQNWARSLAKKSGDVVSDAIDPKKTAEAIAINSGNNIGGTGLSGAAYVASRGGLNAQGYYNDVPAYQQLTANERKSVTIVNPGGSNHGHIDSMAMLAILNKKEAEHFGRSLNSGVIKGNAPASVNITATPPAPTIMSTIISEPTPPVKTAPIDTILFDDTTVPIEIMSDLIFENIGGQELISIVRSDIVNGQKISYQPIKNLSSIQQQYNPNNILGLQQTANRFFAGFSIKLEDKIPEVGNGLNGENVYFDESTGDLIIEFVNLSNDEQIETQITVNGTIYEANLGDYTS
jgi:hypothetical protein